MKRRDFIKKSSAIGVGSFVLPRFSIGQSGPSANGKINIAYIGAGGQAQQAYGETEGEAMVALADVDSRKFGQHRKKYPAIESAAKFEDFRVMLDKLDKEIDAVVVSTPDHTHFAAAMEALQRGKHVAIQKPLTHNIWEARTLRLAHQKYGGITVMANQGHTTDGIRQMREWYQAGIFGQVSAAHCFKDGPKWGNMYFRKPESFPPPEDPVPASLNYDLWLGPVAPRPFHRNYHPLRWRGFNRFGSGQLGDWFCHIADAPVWVLDLYEPTVIEVEEIAGGNEWIAPDGVRIRWEFPERNGKAPCQLYWGNGTVRSKPENVEWGWSQDGRLPQSGTYYIGERSNGYTDERSNNPRLVNREAMQRFKEAGFPEEMYPRVKDGPFAEWVLAIKGEGPEPGSSLDYGARLTEVSYLGVLASQHGGRIEWDAKAMKITNRPELNEFLREPTRPGWEYGEDLWSGV